MNQISKVVVITGASAGVGRATAREFARHGARIGLLARGNDGLNAARREVEELGSEALVIPIDVADADQVESAAAQIEAEFGHIDIWINNAMTSVFSPIKQMTAEEFRRVTEVTYLGYVYGTLAALKRMLPRDRGVIVQVGSALAYRGIPLQAAYCAAKHAVQGFCDSLWCELLHDNSNVKVTMVHMPALNTPQFGWVKSRLPRKAQPVPPIFQPEVAAEAIYFAAHNPRREFYVGLPTVESHRCETKLRRVYSIVISPASDTIRNNTTTRKIRTDLITYGSPFPVTTAHTARSTRALATGVLSGGRANTAVWLRRL